MGPPNFLMSWDWTFGAAPVQPILPSYLHPQKYMSRFFSVQHRCRSSYHLIFECLGIRPSVLHRCSPSYHPTCTLKNICPDFFRCSTSYHPTCTLKNICPDFFRCSTGAC